MNIKELREKKNLTQEELSSQTGIPRARISKWEQGKGKPKVDDLRTLENFFADLLNHNGAPDHPQANSNQAQQMETPIDKLAEANLLNAKSIARMVAMLEEKEKALSVIRASLNEVLENQYMTGAAERQYQMYVIETFWKLQGKKVPGSEVLRELHQKAFSTFSQMKEHGMTLE